MPLSYRELSQPAVEPVTLAIAKKHLVVSDTFTDDDTLITGYITAARQYCERVMNRSIFNRSMVLSCDYFPWPSWYSTTGSNHDSYLAWYFRALSIRLPQPSCVSVDSIQYLDPTGQNWITVDPSNYVVDLISEPARVSPAPGFTWPYQQNYIPGQVKIIFTSGTYGDGIEINTCPQTIVMAILLVVGHFYNHRDATTEATLSNIPLGVDALLAGERFMTMP